MAGIRDLVSLPEAYIGIRSLMDDPQSTIEDFARAVQLDPALTARLLRVANSAFFGVSRKIETISLAVNLMGISRLHDLVLTTSVIGTFEQLVLADLDLENSGATACIPASSRACWPQAAGCSTANVCSSAACCTASANW